MTTTSDILTGRQLLDIFKGTASINDMQNDDYQHCLKVLQDAPQDQPFYAANRSDRYVIGYCLDYFPPIKDQNNGQLV